MASNKIILITGPDQRHRYYINHLNHNFHIAGIIIEESKYPADSNHNPEEQLAWDWYFDRRKKYEAKTFCGSEKLSRKNDPFKTTVPYSSLNTINTIKIIKQL